MKKYQWKNLKLKKKNDKYGWFALGTMAWALLSMTFLPNYIDAENTPHLVALCFLGVALVFMIVAWKAQSDDKKLKK